MRTSRFSLTLPRAMLTLAMLVCASGHARQTAATPAPQPPSWGPTLNGAYAAPPPAATEPEAARAKRPARADPELPDGPSAAEKTTPAPQPKADARPRDPSARAPRSRRHAVAQVVTPTPRIMGSAARESGSPVLTYGPALQARPAQPAPESVRGTLPATCTGAGCVDGAGQRLNPGVGNTVTTPQGQLCTRGLVGVQCF